MRRRMYVRSGRRIGMKQELMKRIMGMKQGLTMRIMTNSFVGITQEGYNWFIKKKEGDGGWVLGFIKRCWSERWWSENDRLWLVRNGNNHEGMGRSKQDKKIKVKSEWWQRSCWLCVKLRDEWWKKRFDEKTRMCIRRDGLPRLQFLLWQTMTLLLC